MGHIKQHGLGSPSNHSATTLGELNSLVTGVDLVKSTIDMDMLDRSGIIIPAYIYPANPTTNTDFANILSLIHI